MIIAGILTVLIVINSLLLIFLVLVQLPKKDAGAGLAFGGGAADALFGAGSGNALTKITKWATGIFFVLALFLSLAVERAHRSDVSEFKKALQQGQTQAPMPAAKAPVTSPETTAPAPGPAAAPVAPVAGTNAPAK
jgi:preprotein translocase subunit SecG